MENSDLWDLVCAEDNQREDFGGKWPMCLQQAGGIILWMWRTEQWLATAPVFHHPEDAPKGQFLYFTDLTVTIKQSSNYENKPLHLWLRSKLSLKLLSQIQLILYFLCIMAEAKERGEKWNLINFAYVSYLQHYLRNLGWNWNFQLCFQISMEIKTFFPLFLYYMQKIK